MHRIRLFAIAATLIVAGVGFWVAASTQARVMGPIGAKGIDPLQIMMNARGVPTEHFADHSFVFN